ncbi:MAG TPA: flagellar M-ring protein FliF [Syntrophaceticus sp.]|nr:flagellar M-ring protein FliF [Syntrophaceticus sp.]
MKQALLNQKEKALNFWNKLTKVQKILFGSGFAAIILAAIIMIFWISKPNYVPLYTDLNTEDAAAITEYLKENKIAYQLDEGGSTVLVPESQKYDIRLALANEGLPTGGSIGFESFNENRFGETESQRRVRYLIALQGELERTIGKLDAVDDVRVHIVVPEPSLFLKDKTDATAAVLVKIKPGHHLDAAQVKGIMNLVASGVEGLEPKNVTVVDTGGNILSTDVESEETTQSSSMTAKQHQVEQEYEKRIENSVQKMLDQIVGKGKSVVNAHVSLDFDQVEIHREIYGDNVVRSEETEEEETTNNETPGGPPGSDSNIPGDQYQEQEEGTGSTSKYKRKTKNYEIDKEEEHRIVAPGEIKRLSLSVVLDAQPADVDQNEIKDLVSSAVGLDPERGDQLTVTCMPFDRSWTDEMKEEMEAAKKRQQYLIYGAAAVVVILLFAVITLLLRRRRSLEDRIDYITEGLTVDEVLDAQERELSQEEKEKARIVEKIKTEVRNQPEKAAELIKAWLNEDLR